MLAGVSTSEVSNYTALDQCAALVIVALGGARLPESALPAVRLLELHVRTLIESIREHQGLFLDRSAVRGG